MLLDDLADHLLQLGAAVVLLGRVHENAQQVVESLFVVDAEEPPARQVTHPDPDKPTEWRRCEISCNT